MTRIKAVLAFEPFYTNGESPPLGAALAKAVLESRGFDVFPMDFCWLTRVNEPGLFNLVKRYTGIWRNNKRVNFVNNIELLLYLLFPESFRKIRLEIDLGLNKEALEYDLLSLALEKHSIIKAGLILKENPKIIFFSSYISNLVPSLLTIQKIKDLNRDIPVFLAGPGVNHPETRKLIKLLFPENLYFACEPEMFHSDSGSLPAEFGDLSACFNILCSPEKLVDQMNKSCFDVTFKGFPGFGKDLAHYFMGYSFPEKGEFMAGVSSYLPVLPATGCVMNCAFCSESAIWGKIHPLDPQAAAENMKKINQLSPGSVFMMNSSLMNFDYNWLKEFCAALLTVFKGTPPFWWCYMRPDAGLMQDNVLKMLYNSGLRWISYGLESGSQNMLFSMGKGTNPHIFTDLLRLTSLAGITSASTLLTGFPNEEEKDFELTCRVLENWYSTDASRGLEGMVFFDAGGMIRLEPDSILYKNREKYGISVYKRDVLLPDELKGLPGLKKQVDKIALDWNCRPCWDVKTKRQRRLINLAHSYGQAVKGRAW